MRVIATAGHVDHGKSALVQALTGTDPDRLQEEKDRGLTIDLGFAHFTLPNGEEVSIVDVPGHERFVKNMLAGVGGIDLVLLMVAADEGVKPQTLEHLHILDLLAVSRGVVVLTKSDLVDSSRLEDAQLQVAELISTTALRDAPIVACSATTGTGLYNLIDILTAQLALTPQRLDIGRPRLPVDRVFTMQGFGTIVTGTLIDGSLKVGQTVEACPGGVHARIRGLHHHGRSTHLALPGSRTAVNLAGVAVEQLRRGVVLAPPGALSPVTAINVQVTAVADLPHPLPHNRSVRFHTATSEVGARLILLNTRALEPGQSALAQLRFRGPIAILSGDRFILRDPNGTVGGGRAVDINPPRKAKQTPHLTLAGDNPDSPSHRFLAALTRIEPASVADVAGAAGIADPEALLVAQTLAGKRKIVPLDNTLSAAALVVTSIRFETLEGAVTQTLTDYHNRSPLEGGIRREELRSRLKLEPRVFERLVARLIANGAVNAVGARLALPQHKPSLSPEQRTEAERYLGLLLDTPYTPPTDSRPSPAILGYLEETGVVVRAGDIIFHRKPYDEMVEQIVARLKTDGTITLATVRDMFGTSRKYAQALVEHLDTRRVTRRVGDERVLR